jgi:hypothetical protein
MKKAVSILFLAIGAMYLSSCSKPSDSVKGYYSGTFTFNGASGGTATTDVVVVDANTVQTIFSFNGGANTSLSQVDVTQSGNNYSLSYTDGSGSFTGTVSGNNLTWSLSSGGDISTFTGNK